MGVFVYCVSIVLRSNLFSSKRVTSVSLRERYTFHIKHFSEKVLDAQGLAKLHVFAFHLADSASLCLRFPPPLGSYGRAGAPALPPSGTPAGRPRPIASHT